MTRPRPRAFTFISKKGLLRSLNTEVRLIFPGGKQSPPFKAVWDTGATRSVVTRRVSRHLDPVGVTQILGVNSETIVFTYFASLLLPNNEVVRLQVAEVESAAGPDVLVGMDIIALGDFAVSSYEGTTSFTFRMPSQERIDFTAA